ncbi:MAG: alpha-ribazole phosphatase family protein [Gammaproteobacteria bacterium]|nr:MAG: alpha-ribazole phosphatase family protein [Gammaproteobacteria bacterium]
MAITTVDLLRHGEPVGGRKYRGQQDDPLTEKGWDQMTAAVGDQRPWDVIVSSSLSRCIDFAEALAQRHAIPLESCDQLKEIGFGEWEGQTARELTRKDPEILLRFWSDPENNVPPGAEPLADFCDRVIGVWDEIIDRYKTKHILLVGHAGVIRMILRHVLEMPLANTYRIKIPGAGLSRICLNEAGDKVFPQLMFHGASL